MEQKIEQFKDYLRNEEKAEATVNKYVHDVALLYKWHGNRTLCKEAVREFKAYLEKHYTATSVNTMLSSLNSVVRSFFCKLVFCDRKFIL